MNKRISVGITAALILIAVTITFTATMIFAMNQFDSKVISSSTKREGVFERLAEIDNLVRQYYYQDIDEDMLYDSMIDGFMQGLGDGTSIYLTAEEVALRNQQSRGTVIGVGIEVAKDVSGYLYVNKVYSESPADRVEIKEGDVITTIDDNDVRVIGYEEAVKLLYGVEGTKVVVEYTRGSDVNTAEMTYTTLETSTVDYMRIDDIFYIRIKSMNDATPAQFTRALRDAESAYYSGDARGMVIDLRDLDGGYSRTVVSQMLTNLMPVGTLYYGQYRDGTTKVLDTSDNENPVSMPTGILVNSNTRGLAELFAAVLGERGNCRIIGTTTAGLGTLDELHMLSDGSGISISVAVFSTPGGKTFNEEGVKPDFEVEPPDNFVLTGQPTEDTDTQYKKAAEIVRAMTA